jgi:hypothetical protein
MVEQDDARASMPDLQAALAELRTDLRMLHEKTVDAAPVLAPTLGRMQEEMLRMADKLERQTDPLLLNDDYSEWNLFLDRLSTVVGLQRIYRWHVGASSQQPEFESLHGQIVLHAMRAMNALGYNLSESQLRIYYGLELEPLHYVPGRPRDFQFKDWGGTWRGMLVWSVLLAALSPWLAALPLAVGMAQLFGMRRAGVDKAASVSRKADEKLTAFERTWYNAFHEGVHRWLTPLALQTDFEEFVAFGTDMVTWIFVPIYHWFRGDGSHLYLSPEDSRTLIAA